MNNQIEKIQPTGIFTNYIFKTIPLAFDESMSYYETLCGILSLLKTQEEVVNNNAELLAELENYVTHYFDNLDVTTEINNKLDEMVEDGTMLSLVKPYFDNYIQPQINEQNSNITEFETNVNNNITQFEADVNNNITQFETNVNNEISTFETTTNGRLTTMDNKIDSVSSGSPAGVYPTLTALQTDDPNHSKIYLVTANGNWYYYDTTNSAWISGGTYQASTNVLNANLNDEVLNLFNVYPLNITGYIRNDGTLSVDESFVSTDFIPIKYFTKAIMHLKLSGLVSNYHYIHVYGSNSSSSSLSYNNLLAGFDPTLIDEDNDVYSIDLTDYEERGDYIRITTHVNNVTSNDGLYMNMTDLTRRSLTSFQRNLSAGWLEANNITSIKQLEPNYVYYMGSTNTLSDMPDSTGLKTLIKLYGRRANDTNSYCQYICTTSLNEMFICYGTGANTLTNWKKIITSDDVLFNEAIFSALNVKYNFNKMFTAFSKFGVIGDSLAVGYYTDSENNQHTQNLKNSWPQKICDIYNMEYVNFAKSGITAHGWVRNSDILADIRNQNNICQAYIIGIGANPDTSIGSVSDIDLTDYTNNADTMYGNYASIIQIIQEVNPSAKIFTLTLPYPRVHNDRNTCIKNVSALFDNVTVVDLEGDYNSLFQNDYIANNYYNHHFTPAGYSNIAELLMYCISDTMYQNRTDFYDIPLIPYSN